MVKKWAMQEYGIKEEDIVRPFFPHMEYEEVDYKGKVVVDNPPFSILRRILDWYEKHNVKYFLFSPTQTTMSLLRAKNVSAVMTDARIEYENGAVINTSFVTNMDEHRIRTAPKLNSELKRAVGDTENKVQRYMYPRNVIRGTQLALLGAKGADVRIGKHEIKFVRELDEQKEMGKKIFGDGGLVSDKVADMIEKANSDYSNIVHLELSQREKEEIAKMGQ